MATSDSQQTEFVSPLSLFSRTKFLIAGFGLVAAVYFGLLVPAKQHMAALQRQCGQLTQIVTQLQGRESSAEQGLRLIELLDNQSNKLAAAESSLNNLIAFRERLVDQAQAVAKTTATLDQLHAVEQKVASYNETLQHMTSTLAEMAEVAAAIAESSAESSKVAQKAKDSLGTLAELQSGLAGEITSVSGQLTSLENKIANRSSNLPAAEQTLAQIDELCELLATQSATVSTARLQLTGLVRLKNEVLEQSARLPKAAALLTMIWDLHEGMIRSSDTIAAAQQMVVEVMLMEPAMERAVAALKPMSDYHRLSSRLSAAGAPTTAVNSVRAALTSSPWAEVLKVAVTMLMPLR